MKKVELHIAFSWTCPGCGCDHFERAIRCEDPDIAEDPGDGDLCLAPEVVTCPGCGVSYETTDARDDDEDFDDSSL